MRISTSVLGSSTALFALCHAEKFDWDALTPTWDLRYTKCYSRFQCARILMPLDYLDAKSDNRTVSIAVLKVPATVDVSDPSYGGTVMVNPGGPGDSGVLHMLRNGDYIQGMVDGSKHYEVLSFDLRGVAFSTPRADCYSNEAARQAAMWQSRGLGEPTTSDESLTRHLAQARAFGRQCANYRDEGVDFNIHEYTSTASIAKDMLRLVDETEKLRRKDVAAHTGKKGGAQQPLTDGATENKQGRLLYYGTSYGTVLGNTFLSMFPGRVRRMILDGVVVGESWVHGDWEESIRDTGYAMNYLYKTCFDIGSNCTLRKDNDKSWHDIDGRVNAMVEHLNAHPLSAPTKDGPELVITGADILQLIFSQLYSPLDFFESLLATLALAVDGNYTEVIQDLVPPTEDNDDDGDKDTDAAEGIIRWYTWMSSTFASILCADTKPLDNEPVSYFKHALEHIEKRYPRLGSLIATSSFICAGWQSHPKDRFTGPFTSPEADANEVEGRPTAPLLLLSSLYDPITPLASAHTVAKGHPGARVLTQKSVGHCTLLAGPSECTKRVVRMYMENGTLPREGTTCDGDCRPFEDCPYERGRFPR